MRRRRRHRGAAAGRGAARRRGRGKIDRAPAADRGHPARAGGLGGIEDFLHAYSLSTKEGLALMVLAEALLRVPDADTADRLIEDKLATGEWDTAELKSDAFLVSASAWTLGITARIIQPGETPESILDGLLKRLGLPAVRTATRQAMRLLGSHFVLGQTIEEALRRAARIRRLAIPSTCWGRARAPRPTPAAISKPTHRHRRHRRERRRRRAARPARHLDQALGAASALRGGVAGARPRRAGAGRAGARAQGARARPQFHRRCRGGGPAGADPRRDRRRCSPIPRCAAGKDSGSRCRPIRSAPRL